MSRMKTYAIALFLPLILPQAAGAGMSDPLVTTFATCTGRFSALMEHQWLMGSAEADRTQARRAAFEEVLLAAMPSDAGPEVLARRIEAKYALAQLLQRVTFGTDPKEADWAADRVRRAIAACDGLVLG